MKGKRAERKQKSRCEHYGRILTVVGIAAIVLCFMGGLAARYITKREIVGNTVEAGAFYFTVDLLRDDGVEDIKKTFHIYGGGEKKLKFSVWNHLDTTLRVTKQDIDFTMTLSGDTWASSCEIRKDGVAVTSGTLTGGSTEKPQYVLRIPEGYGDKDKVQVVIKSTAPYEKTITLEFVLHKNNADLLYRVEDEIGNPVARLIIMANKDIAAGKIQIDVSAANASGNLLQVDMVEAAISQNNDGVTPPVITDEAGYFKTQKIIITQPMIEGESIDIIFYKSDLNKLYFEGSEDIGTKVNANLGVYTIALAENSGS